MVESRPGIRMIDFDTDLDGLMMRAEFIVSMGGYNTVCEILSYEKRALIVPRVVPRTEQLIRARRLSELGLLDCLHPRSLSPGRLSEWMAKKYDPRPKAKRVIDLKGLTRILHLATQLLRNGYSAPAIVNGKIKIPQNGEFCSAINTIS
jgi:predicted glycosyltransferase